MEGVSARPDTSRLCAVQRRKSPGLPAGKYTFGAEFTPERAGKCGESIGTTTLYLNEKVVAEGSMRARTDEFPFGEAGTLNRLSRDAARQCDCPAICRPWTPGVPR
jgi:hypothetical protein